MHKSVGELHYPLHSPNSRNTAAAQVTVPHSTRQELKEETSTKGTSWDMFLC